MSDKDLITKEAACEAVRMAWDNYHHPFSAEQAIAAIRALPAPEPVVDDELAEAVGRSILSFVQSRMMEFIRSLPEWFIGRLDEKPKSYEELDAQDKSAIDGAARAALSVVREHDRREADEVREVLRKVLEVVGGAVDELDYSVHILTGIKDGSNRERVEDVRDRLKRCVVRATRAAKVKP